METKEKTNERILKILAKEPLSEHTATSLSKSLKISRQGVWKSLRKLAQENIISFKSVADTKNSVLRISLNFKNPLTARTLSLVLEKETQKYERWKDNFSELSAHSGFVILFGSILHNPKDANDIDLLVVVNEKKDFGKIDKTIMKLQQTQIKKIHGIDIAKEELKKELDANANKAYIDAFKKGILLSGHDDYIRFIQEL